MTASDKYTYQRTVLCLARVLAGIQPTPWDKVGLHCVCVCVHVWGWCRVAAGLQIENRIFRATNVDLGRNRHA